MFPLIYIYLLHVMQSFIKRQVSPNPSDPKLKLTTIHLLISTRGASSVVHNSIYAYWISNWGIRKLTFDGFPRFFVGIVNIGQLNRENLRWRWHLCTLSTYNIKQWEAYNNLNTCPTSLCPKKTICGMRFTFRYW